jgi:hypothetical protein
MKKKPTAPVPKAETVHLKKTLNAYPAFADVDHARFQTPDGTRTEQPDVLEFSYRDRPYFAHCAEGKVVISRPGESAGSRPVGKPIPLGAGDLAFLIAQAIDAAGHE